MATRLYQAFLVFCVLALGLFLVSIPLVWLAESAVMEHELVKAMFFSTLALPSLVFLVVPRLLFDGGKWLFYKPWRPKMLTKPLQGLAKCCLWFMSLFPWMFTAGIILLVMTLITAVKVAPEPLVLQHYQPWFTEPNLWFLLLNLVLVGIVLWCYKKLRTCHAHEKAVLVCAICLLCGLVFTLFFTIVMTFFTLP